METMVFCLDKSEWAPAWDVKGAGKIPLPEIEAEAIEIAETITESLTIAPPPAHVFLRE